MVDEMGSERSQLAAIVAALTASGSEPPDDGAPAAGAQSAEELLGPGAAAWTAQLARQLTDGMQANHPAEAVPVEDIATHGRLLIARILLNLTGSSYGGSDLEDMSDESMRQLIALDVPFARVGETTRLVHELVVRALLVVAIAKEASAATLTAITLGVARSMDDALDRMAKQYMLESQRFSSSVERSRQDLIDMLIAEVLVDDRVVRDVLSVLIEEHHVGFVISGAASAVRFGRHTLRRPVEVIKHALNVSHVVVRENQDSMWVWASSSRPFVLDEAALAAEIGSAVRVGIGSAQPAAAGFRRTFLEAVDANRFAHRVSAASVIGYERHSLAILLSAEPERARWFVESELGELLVSSPRNRELLMTLRCYFDSKLRIAVAAERLHVHRNTAIARLSSLEAILGHPVTERMAEVQSALSILEFVDGTEVPPRP